MPTPLNAVPRPSSPCSKATGYPYRRASNQAGLAQLWQPAAPDALSTVAAIKETYALAPWAGPTGGGVLVATALGLGRWHPTAAPALLPWPQPMALDNHWVLLGES